GQAPGVAGLSDRRFTVRQAFGCAGPVERGKDEVLAAGVGRWRWGPKNETIEVSLTPADWSGLPLFAEGGAKWEAVEGYWLTQPWLRAEGCPADRVEDDVESVPAVAAGAPQTSGLAAVYAEDSSRLGRRDGKAFMLTVRGEAPLIPTADGYRLVLEGRFSAFPDGQAIRCHSTTSDQTPVCIAAAHVDRVAFEDAEGKLLKEWRIG
ncbi:MAG TPA: hypothetical protein VIO94_11460, partial [Phenylobacterium sp.]